jgi:hypothetical protein
MSISELWKPMNSSTVRQEIGREGMFVLEVSVVV